jgi:hypothetical protein
MISVMTRSPGARLPLEPPVPWLPPVPPLLLLAASVPVLLVASVPVLLAPPAPVTPVLAVPLAVPAEPPVPKGEVSPLPPQPAVNDAIDTPATATYLLSRARFISPCCRAFVAIASVATKARTHSGIAHLIRKVTL